MFQMSMFKTTTTPPHPPPRSKLRLTWYVYVVFLNSLYKRYLFWVQNVEDQGNASVRQSVQLHHK